MVASKTRQCTKCLKNRAAKFFSGPRGRICSSCSKKSRSKASHANRVEETYGLLKGEYEKLIEAQGGVCAICGQSRNYRLNLDHSHKTGLLRGGCCRLCNGRLLTAARDNPAVLRAAADYLENPPAIRILGPRLHKDFREDS
ncbi:endonuclease domain-containing protein [Streptomyces sp. NBC_01197]|uniref:endonuclease domain-containing protein n=1 Tax=Streptomyces sp. NBC_01197 TaxID=2903768 RepID=UPI002E1538B5|nr:endonuclease VII domain-containing protein [Streptomyces sp. NBC_01197]